MKPSTRKPRVSSHPAPWLVILGILVAAQAVATTPLAHALILVIELICIALLAPHVWRRLRHRS